jgi:hypothetical protein
VEVPELPASPSQKAPFGDDKIKEGSIGFPPHRPAERTGRAGPEDYNTSRHGAVHVMAELKSSIPRRCDAISSLVIKGGSTRTKAPRPCPYHFGARPGRRHKLPEKASPPTSASAMDRHFNRPWTMSIL